jgi:hypothetical protein
MENNTLVKFDMDSLPTKYHYEYRNIGLEHDDVFIYLGDIIQMPGHCTVIRMKDNKVFTGMHTENFTPVTDDEDVIDIILD